MATIKDLIKTLPIFKKLYKKLDNQFERDAFVIAELKKFKQVNCY
jgi:hypothetical protein